jgi:hypothetical protein
MSSMVLGYRPGAEIKNFIPKLEHWSDCAFLVQKSGAE